MLLMAKVDDPDDGGRRVNPIVPREAAKNAEVMRQNDLDDCNLYVMLQCPEQVAIL